MAYRDITPMNNWFPEALVEVFARGSYYGSLVDLDGVSFFEGSDLTLPDTKYVYHGIDRGDGQTGLLHASNIADAAGAGSDLTADILKSGEQVDDVTGTLTASGGETVHAWVE